MKELYVLLLDLGLAGLKQFISSLTTAKAPQEVIDAVQAALNAVQEHQLDVMSKADWEQLRG